MSLRISSIIKPTKVVEFKIKDGKDQIVVKIHLEGVSSMDEQYIESVRFKRYKTDSEADKAGLMYVSRLIRHCVKKVEGITLVDENDKETPFEVEFMTDEKKEITDDSYTMLMRALADQEVVEEVLGFYNKSNNLRIKKKAVKKNKKKA